MVTKMLNLDEIRKKLSDRQLNIVAARVGLHYNTLYKFMRGDDNITIKTLEKIYNYLSKD
jgi:transcriptional regulator with XRE-family HTH domain